MTIKINTDNEVTGDADFKEYYKNSLQDSMSRFEQYVTRYEVFFSDESNNKETQNDQKVVIEARLKGIDPERVSNNADDPRAAFDGAVKKMQRVLDRVIKQRRNY